MSVRTKIKTEFKPGMIISPHNSVDGFWWCEYWVITDVFIDENGKEWVTVRSIPRRTDVKELKSYLEQYAVGIHDIKVTPIERDFDAGFIKQDWDIIYPGHSCTSDEQDDIPQCISCDDIHIGDVYKIDYLKTDDKFQWCEKWVVVCVDTKYKSVCLYPIPEDEELHELNIKIGVSFAGIELNDTKIRLKPYCIITIDFLKKYFHPVIY
jgi:hypothetical protein